MSLPPRFCCLGLESDQGAAEKQCDAEGCLAVSFAHVKQRKLSSRSASKVDCGILELEGFGASVREMKEAGFAS